MSSQTPRFIPDLQHVNECIAALNPVIYNNDRLEDVEKDLDTAMFLFASHGPEIAEMVLCEPEQLLESLADLLSAEEYEKLKTILLEDLGTLQDDTWRVIETVWRWGTPEHEAIRAETCRLVDEWEDQEEFLWTLVDFIQLNRPEYLAQLRGYCVMFAFVREEY